MVIALPMAASAGEAGRLAVGFLWRWKTCNFGDTQLPCSRQKDDVGIYGGNVPQQELAFMTLVFLALSEDLLEYFPA